MGFAQRYVAPTLSQEIGGGDKFETLSFERRELTQRTFEAVEATT